MGKMKLKAGSALALLLLGYFTQGFFPPLLLCWPLSAVTDTLGSMVSLLGGGARAALLIWTSEGGDLETEC